MTSDACLIPPGWLVPGAHYTIRAEDVPASSHSYTSNGHEAAGPQPVDAPEITCSWLSATLDSILAADGASDVHNAISAVGRQRKGNGHPLRYVPDLSMED